MDFGLSHLRALKQSEVAKSRCFRKSDADEISLIEDVLGRMTDLDSDSQQNDDSQTSQPPHEPSQAIVPKPAEPAPSNPTNAMRQGTLAIFSAVNERASFLDQPRNSHVATTSSQVPGNAVQFGGFLTGLVNIGTIDPPAPACCGSVRRRSPSTKASALNCRGQTKPLRKRCRKRKIFWRKARRKSKRLVKMTERMPAMSSLKTPPPRRRKSQEIVPEEEEEEGAQEW